MSDMVTLSCEAVGCGIEFAVPEAWNTARRNDHATFYCPNGHARQSSGETEVEKLQRWLVQARASKDYWVDRTNDAKKCFRREERSHAATRGHLTRIRNRIASGACPCCKQTFKNLQQHIASKHPEYAGGKDG